ncbi:hypothetical protein PsYK624_079910 [Phanerochaete sordida]|uniref:DUF6534 domain-containing protein n=1 Tax=Phanerochaete sordida TaxID=48140 RepID=A0A9P3LE25_9APHY|nr:hypothetical protein PsYK624_079910 [Phanerochaete sordida]
MTFYLRRNKSDFSTLNDIIDTLILYTMQTGMVTCCMTAASLACWVSMPNNLIFLGLHFTISKLYANSFLAMLNSRVILAESRSTTTGATDRPRPIKLSDFRKDSEARWRRPAQAPVGKALEVSVHTTVDREICHGDVHARADCYEVSDEDIAQCDESKSPGSPV